MRGARVHTVLVIMVIWLTASAPEFPRSASAARSTLPSTSRRTSVIASGSISGNIPTRMALPSSKGRAITVCQFAAVPASPTPVPQEPYDDPSRPPPLANGLTGQIRIRRAVAIGRDPSAVPQAQAQPLPL